MEILLATIFHPYFLIPSILTGILPLRWVFRFWILVAIACLGFSAFQTQASISNDGSIGYALGIGLLIIYGIFLSVIVIARLIIQKIRKKKPKTHLLETKAIHGADIFLFLITGVVVSIFASRVLAFSLGGLPHGLLIHGGLSLTLMALTGTMLRFLLKNKQHPRFKGLIFILTLSFGLLLFSTLGAFYPYAVIQSAQKIAGGNPYCIGLNMRSRPLNSLEDLTLLTMDKSTHGHHAFLLVEKEDTTLESYHWSYFQSKFLPGVVNWTGENSPPIPCRPAHDFTENMPYINNAGMQVIDFYFHGHFLRIPKEYAPRVSSNYISLAVQAPYFKPADHKNRHFHASMEIRSRAWLESLHKDYAGFPPTGKIGNLTEIKNARSHTDWHYRFNEKNQLATAAGCYSSRPPETACQHRFYRNGAMYTFDHSKELLSRSDEMEEDLFDLFESFKED